MSGTSSAAVPPESISAPTSTEFEVPADRPADTPGPRSSSDLAKTGAGLLRSTAVGIGTALHRPLASFHLVLGLTAILTVLGLVMVLSASSVEDISATGSPYSKFTDQLMYVSLGLVAFVVALYVRPTTLRRLALAGVLVSIGLLIAVLIPGVGTKVGGARRWIDLGVFTLQPSEVAKVALIIWGAHLLADRSRARGIKELLLPLFPVALLMAALIVAEPNQSTAMIVLATACMVLFYAGLSARLFVGFAVAGVGAAIFFALVEGYRSARLAAWLGRTNDALGVNYQSNQARFSLADGGFFGVGLGNSTAKWSYLPNAHNDFIFAIIGEELGYLGAGVVIAMFGLITWVGLRIARRVADPFLQLLAATITTLIALQAIINMGYVVGLLPVTGIQLPLLSAGGNSVILVLFMLGLLAGAARNEPEAIAALVAGREGRAARLLRLPTPRPYLPPRPARAAGVRRAPAPRGEPSPYDRHPYGDARLARPRPDARPVRAPHRATGPVRGQGARAMQHGRSEQARRRGQEKGRRAW